MSAQRVPLSIRVLGWLLIIASVSKLTMTFWSWEHFELWRTILLTILKLLALAAGVALIRGRKIGAYFYWISVVITTAIFYTMPPNLPGIERYFSPAAIALAIIAPIIFTAFFIANWRRLA